MRTRTTAIVVALALGGAGLACQAGPGESREDREAFTARMKAIEKRIKDAMPKTQEIALRQNVDEKTVRKVQAELAALREYLDEPSGRMDFVTVNAIQAFQRQVGLEDDGLLDEETLARLEEEAKKVERGETGYFEKGYYRGLTG